MTERQEVESRGNGVVRLALSSPSYHPLSSYRTCHYLRRPNDSPFKYLPQLEELARRVDYERQKVKDKGTPTSEVWVTPPQRGAWSRWS